MPWMPYKKNCYPEKHDEYYVIKFYPGVSTSAFFRPIPTQKKIEIMKYIQTMELEQEFHDRCVYVKQNVWEDAYGIRQKPEEILYWFKLDPIPED